MPDATVSPSTRDGMRAGARLAAPIAVAAFAFGISFGVLAESAGFGGLAALVMSATTFGGSAQFATVSVLDAGGGLAAAIAAAVMLNLRYGPIALSIAPSFTGPRWRRALESQLVVDESWALATRSDGSADRAVLLGVGIVLWLAWVSGTALGLVGGELVGDPERLGLDAAFPALFLALLVQQIEGRRALQAALLGGAIALALIPLTSPGIPLLAAAAACLLGVGRR